MLLRYCQPVFRKWYIFTSSAPLVSFSCQYRSKKVQIIWVPECCLEARHIIPIFTISTLCFLSNKSDFIHIIALLPISYDSSLDNKYLRQRQSNAFVRSKSMPYKISSFSNAWTILSVNCIIAVITDLSPRFLICKVSAEAQYV